VIAEGMDMAGKRSTPEQVVAEPRQVAVLTAQGKAVAEAVRAIGISGPRCCRWRAECGGLEPGRLDRLGRLKRLKRLKRLGQRTPACGRPWRTWRSGRRSSMVGRTAPDAPGGS
jgi:putative transposase